MGLPSVAESIQRLSERIGDTYSEPVHESSIVELEHRTGRRIPRDYREFITEFGAEGSIEYWVTPYLNLAMVRWHSIFHPTAVASMCDYLRDNFDEEWPEIDRWDQWHEHLVPIQGTPQYLLCFDYRFDDKNPPIVMLKDDGVTSHHVQFDALEYVADSFTHLLSLTHYTDHREPYPDAPTTPTERQKQWYTARNEQLGLPRDAWFRFVSSA